MKKEIYISIDIEADGPIPGDNSMLSLGAVAFDEDGVELESFSMNLEPLEEAKQDQDTMERFWAKNPEAWKEATQGSTPADQVIWNFSNWLKRLKDSRESKLVSLSYPATFDHMWVHWYMHHFLGEDVLGFSGLDIKSYGMAVLDTSFHKTTKRKFPKEWFPENHIHTHIAVEDAREQGNLFFAMRDWNRKKCLQKQN